MKKRSKHKRGTFKGLGLYILIGIVALSILLFALSKYQHSQLPGEAVPTMGNKHIPNVNAPHEEYNTTPPTSGPHVEYIAQWGVYEEPLPYEVLVHNLEDGGVVIYYSEEAKSSEIKRLMAIVNEYRQHVILVPDLKMENTITLTAWGRIDKLNSFEEPRVREFIDAYIGMDHHKR